jgi:hypothetical protein
VELRHSSPVPVLSKFPIFVVVPICCTEENQYVGETRLMHRRGESDGLHSGAIASLGSSFLPSGQCESARLPTLPLKLQVRPDLPPGSEKPSYAVRVRSHEPEKGRKP